MSETAPETGPSPFEKPVAPTAPSLNGERSIVDTMLDLDEFLSGEVRLAEKTAYFATRPDLQADIEALEHQLEMLTDALGRPLGNEIGEASIGDGEPTVLKLAREIEAKRAEYNASLRGVRVRQLQSDDWAAFRTKHKRALADTENPIPSAVWDELIVACAIQPEFTLEKIRALRKKVGSPQVAAVELACWNVCTNSGVSIPKSSLSSRVLKQRVPEQN